MLITKDQTPQCEIDPEEVRRFFKIDGRKEKQLMKT
jgi:hypothetical protein